MGFDFSDSGCVYRYCGKGDFPDRTSERDAENIFVTLAESFLPPILAGFVMAGILAATISSSDSYLLIAASAFAKNIYQGLFRKKATDKEVMNVSRITLLAIAIVAVIGLIAGLGLSTASAALEVPADETVENLRAALPGANCGACGFSGCDGYAAALAAGDRKSVV